MRKFFTDFFKLWLAITIFFGAAAVMCVVPVLLFDHILFVILWVITSLAILGAVVEAYGQRISKWFDVLIS